MQQRNTNEFTFEDVRATFIHDFGNCEYVFEIVLGRGVLNVLQILLAEILWINEDALENLSWEN